MSDETYLTDKHFDSLVTVLNNNARVREGLRRARAAGLDFHEAEQKEQQQSEVCRGICQQFFPGRSIPG